MVMLKPLSGFYLIIDSHNAGISPLEGRNKIVNYLAVFIQRTANLTLVTNMGLRKIVEGNKGRGFVLPDRIPSVESIGRFNFEQGKRVVFVCTFSDDEPYNQVFEAAKSLPDGIKIYVTGRYQGKVDKKNMPNNIRLLGFVPDEEYWAILFGSDVVIDLTTRENCLVCGAYEGIALNKPLILSDTNATKELFEKGCVYVKPVAEEIRLGILECLNRHEMLLKEICQLRKTMIEDWKLKIVELEKTIILDTEKKIT
jgi:glycosyltransferase involved in cell wall biosynthesis